MKRNASMPSIATRARQAAAPLSIAVHLHGLHGLTLQLAQPRTRQLLLLFLIICSLFSLQNLCATANWALPALIIRPQLTINIYQPCPVLEQEWINAFGPGG